MLQCKNRHHRVVLPNTRTDNTVCCYSVKTESTVWCYPIQEQSIQSGGTQCKNKTLSGVAECKIEITEWLYQIQEQRDQ